MKRPSNMLMRYYNEQFDQGSRDVPFRRLPAKQKAALKGSIGYKVWQIGEALHIATGLVVCIAMTKALDRAYVPANFTKGGISYAPTGSGIELPPMPPAGLSIVKADLGKMAEILKKRLKKVDSSVLRA